MLQLKDITKNYKVAGGEIKVLKGLNLAFRESEFVSILGPSGCGKTTTLNIVGGLDKYTSGDLVIAGKSTKNFTDRDWDIYRNQRIGFIFQSYNLIPHQTVLGNVELALTISGVSKEERIKRAMDALEKVGLKGEEYKRPNQLSGGQCQRVAIARALVNEPDILLADEPTGALDSKTSVQIMDLIKEISKDKLVIMVTHNAEIAEQYSTRIIRLVDGEVVEDTNPHTQEQEERAVSNLSDKKKDKKSKAKMSWWTAFKLSARNLFSKRGRTLLTSIAGSIGIIGISAVIAVSTGVRTYISNMQDDMLSGNPITVKETGYDFSAMMNGMTIGDKKVFLKEKGYVNVDSMIEFFAEQYKKLDSFVTENEITQDYVDYVLQMPKDFGAINVDYGIDITNNIYTDFKVTDGKEQNQSLSALRSTYTSIMKKTELKDQATFISSLGDVYMQSIPDENYILTQYDLLDGGKIATEKDEIMIVVNKDKALTDLMLAQLGYFTQEEFMEFIYAVDDIEDNEGALKDKFTYQELKDKSFTWYANDVVYSENASNLDTNNYNAPFVYNNLSDNFTETLNANNKIELKIVGILMPKENINYGCLSAGMYYTEKLTEHILTDGMQSKVVKYMNDSGIENFGGMVMENPMASQPGASETMAVSINKSAIIPYDYEYYYEDYSTPLKATSMVGNIDAMSGLISSMMPGGAGSAGAKGDMYSCTIREMGGINVSNDLSIYPADFNTKDKVTEYLDKWNEKGDIIVGDKTITYDERSEIVYTDNLSLVISMINAMIDIITIALVSFTSLALVVSCVMIAIITYVSVVERVKEIGVIRSLGGRKRDVSNLFNAETLIIGASSGLVGIGFTYLLSFIVNIIVKNAAGFSIMLLPLSSAGIMVGLSILLTVLSGLIPAKKAAHQDPVVALRTE